MNGLWKFMMAGGWRDAQAMHLSRLALTHQSNLVTVKFAAGGEHDEATRTRDGSTAQDERTLPRFAAPI
jgi:hypothetical protein